MLQVGAIGTEEEQIHYEADYYINYSFLLLSRLYVQQYYYERIVFQHPQT
jgi:hypothetical protein